MEEYLRSSPFTVARLKREPGMRVYKHGICLNGLRFHHAGSAELTGFVKISEGWLGFETACLFDGLEDIDAEIAERLRGLER